MQTGCSPCRCGIPDWKKLRSALGLTQKQMAGVLCISEVGVHKLEKLPHHCPRNQTVMILRAWLEDNYFKHKLKEAGYEHPFTSVK